MSATPHTQPIFHVLPYTTQGKDKQKNKPVWGLFQDSEGEIWLGGENEAVVFKDNKQLKSFDITKYLSRPYGQVFSLHEMTPGTFLLGIYDDGLLKLDTKSNRIERIKLDMSNIDHSFLFQMESEYAENLKVVDTSPGYMMHPAPSYNKDGILFSFKGADGLNYCGLFDYELNCKLEPTKATDYIANQNGNILGDLFYSLSLQNIWIGQCDP